MRGFWDSLITARRCRFDVATSIENHEFLQRIHASIFVSNEIQSRSIDLLRFTRDLDHLFTRYQAVKGEVKGTCLDIEIPGW
jgi:hypothetical protein